MRDGRVAGMVRYAVVVVALLGVGLSWGCGDDDGSASGSKTTLTLMALTTNQPAYDPLIENFERAHPKIDVQATYLPGDRFVQTVQTQLQAGNAPDMFWAAAGASSPVSVFALASAGQLLDLSKEPWAAEMPKELTPLFSHDGKLYGGVLYLNLVPVHYNVGEFERLGLSVPETFSELLSLCGTISKRGKVPIAQSGVAGSLQNYVFASTLASNDVYGPNPRWNAERASGSTTFAGSPEWQKALGRIIQMKDAGCFSRGIAGTTGEQAVASFARGDALMMAVVTSAVGAIKAANPEIELSMFAMPGDTAADTWLTINVPHTLAVNADSPHVKEAKTFYEFFMNPEQSSEFATTIGGISVSDYQDGNLRPELKPATKYLEDDHTRPDATVELPPWPSPATAAALDEAMTGLFTGQKSVEDVLKEMDAAYGG